MTKSDRIALIPVVLAAIASSLFAVQGGFGGGHGKFDQAIGLLGLPGILVPLPASAWASDYLPVILVPAALNVALWFGVARAFAIFRRRGG